MTASASISCAPPSFSIKHIPAQKKATPCSIASSTLRHCLSDFDFLRLLGKGDNGNIYLARNINTGKECALKVAAKSVMSPIYATNEGRMQTLISTEGPSFLLPAKANWHDRHNYYIVTDFMTGGDLDIELFKHRSPFDEDRSRFYGAEMITMVEELRQHRIIHRDIKPKNLFINRQGHLRLTGFGYAKKFEPPREYEVLDSLSVSLSFNVHPDCESGAFFTDMPTPEFKTNEICGTPHFMSPQRIAGEDYGDQEDLWSVGVVLYLMMTGRMPFGNKYEKHADIALCVLHKPVDFMSTDLLSDNAKSLLIGMLTKDTRTRLSMEQIKNHAFFEGLDWEIVKNQEYSAPWLPALLTLSVDTSSIPVDDNGLLPAHAYTPLGMDGLRSSSIEANWPPSSKFKTLMIKIFKGENDQEGNEHDEATPALEYDDSNDDDDDDDDHLPIQTIDYSELPFGVHPYDRKLILEGVFDLEQEAPASHDIQEHTMELGSATFEGVVESKKQPVKIPYTPDPESWAMSLQQYQSSETQDMASSLPHPRVDSTSSFLKRSVSFSGSQIRRPPIKASPTSLSVRPGSIVPSSFYRLWAEAAVSSERITTPPEPSRELVTNEDLDADTFNNVKNFSGDLEEEVYGGLMLFTETPISFSGDDLYDNPRPAPVPSLSPPVSPTSTVVSPTVSPTFTLVPEPSSPLSAFSWPVVKIDEYEKPYQHFFTTHKDYRLMPEHIIARRRLKCPKNASASVQKLQEAPEKREVVEEDKGLQPLNFQQGLAWRAPSAPVTQTSIHVEADLNQDSIPDRKKRRSVDLLKTFALEGKERQLSLPKGLVERVWRHTGRMFGSNGVGEQRVACEH